MGYCIDHLPSRLSIGRETETGVTDIRIDCTDWLERWPGMVVAAIFCPPGGTPYILDTEMIGNSLVWHVSDADTAAAGTGQLELTGVAEGKRKLSALVDVQVARRLDGAAGPMPEAAKPWADEVMAAAATVVQNAQEAKAAAVSAGEHAATAGEAAATAETAAATAGEAASTAETAATAAQAAAEGAKEAEAKAQSAADRAEAAAGSGSGGGGDIVVASGKSLIIEDGATVSDVGGALYIAINNATEGLLGYVIQKVLQGGSQKTLVSINPDNSCSMSFSKVSELVKNGNAAFKFTIDALVGAPIQSSWTSSTRINGEVQSAIHAHILVVTENSLKVRILLWGEKSGISVTSKTLSFS